MIIVHHLDHSRSLRILWLLEELGVGYEVRQYRRDKVTRRSPAALADVHPLRKAPVLEDGAVTIAESGAIVEYVLDTYGNGRLRPAKGSADYLRYLEWLHFAEGSAMPPLVFKLVTGIVPERAPAMVRPVAKLVVKALGDGFIDPELAAISAYMEQALARAPWFAGADFTAADIMMSFPARAMLRRAGGDLPAIAGFVAACEARPAYARAVAKGGV
jgi:glutathione S-transferase